MLLEDQRLYYNILYTKVKEEEEKSTRKQIESKYKWTNETEMKEETSCCYLFFTFFCYSRFEKITFI